MESALQSSNGPIDLPYPKGTNCKYRDIHAAIAEILAKSSCQASPASIPYLQHHHRHPAKRRSLSVLKGQW